VTVPLASAPRRLAVAVIQGGPSSEAQVSRASAAGVAGALAAAGHGVVRLELDAFTAESLRTGGYDVVFPIAHGAVGEDGALQGLLEVLDLPYVGSEVLASALAMHKRAARVAFAQAGLPIAPGLAVARGDSRAAAERARRDLGPRVVVKPSAHGSAIGVTRLSDEATLEDVARALEAVWAIDDFAIVERFRVGREITCGVLALGDARALPVTEILSPNDPFYTFAARYEPGRSVHVCPAQLPPAVFARVQQVAVDAHRSLGCRDLSRVDFIVGDAGAPEEVTLLEVNTLPGMTPTSLFPEAAAAAGYSMPALCDALAKQAAARGTARSRRG
jgi:D-alanine-D-alanine ligase